MKLNETFMASAPGNQPQCFSKYAKAGKASSMSVRVLRALWQAKEADAQWSRFFEARPIHPQADQQCRWSDSPR